MPVKKSVVKKTSVPKVSSKKVVKAKPKVVVSKPLAKVVVKKEVVKTAVKKDMVGKTSFGRFFVSLLLVLIGLMFLVGAFNFFPTGAIVSPIQLWPILLVMFGLAILHWPARRILSFALLLSLVAFLLLLISLGWGYNKYYQNSLLTSAPVTRHVEKIIATATGELENLIKVTSPAPMEKITSPLTITGEARGPWFFEASFPIKIVDGDGQILGQTTAQATSDWMTEDYVPFTATLDFSAATSSAGGFLILQKDNPSGLPANDQQLIIPVTF